jgi:hypothetical protein
MRKSAIFVILTFIAAAALSFAEQGSFGVNRTRPITFREQVRIASQVLPAGEYRVQHVMQGENHVLLFKRAGNEFRVNCTMTTLPQKSRDTRLVFNDGPDGRVLIGLVFKGDDFQHDFAQ